MSDNLSQANRTGILTTPFGTDQLALAGLQAREGLSQCFHFTVDAVSTSNKIDFDALLGKHCTVAIKTPNDKKRYFDGIVSEGEFLGPIYVSDETIYSYRLVLKPVLWLLTQRANCRIFQQKTVVDIIKEVLQGLDLEWQVQGNYPTLAYCVQYRETDFTFVSRLMEEWGIYYYFKHEDRKHTMVLVNRCSTHTTIPTLDGGKIPYRPRVQQTDQQEEILAAWHSGRRFRSGKFKLWDHNYLQPYSHLEGQAQSQERYGNSKFEVYDYPGTFSYQEVSDVQPHINSNEQTFPNVRLEAAEAADHRRQATGVAVSLFPGGKVMVVDEPKAKDFKDIESETNFIVIATYHSFQQQMYRSGAAEQETTYQGSYEFLPANQQFRAPQITPCPRIYGIQTALVVGPAGEEIYTDKYGRIKVQFHWDREGKKNQDSSCWIRVAEKWSGKNWGGQFIPRIGMEAVVEFLEGNPDRPLVIGTVYNADYMHPYALPANKTQSGIKTRSSQGGNAANFNELRFEDKKGQEEIFIHAEKNKTVEVENDRVEWVGHDEIITIDNNRTERVKHDETITIDRNRTETVHSNESITVDGNQTIAVGKNIEVTAGTKIVLSVGGNSITIDGSGITVFGNLVKIN
jgi:type VI secretion system secreted protein VgrG